jgi:hypothetical protein
MEMVKFLDCLLAFIIRYIHDEVMRMKAEYMSSV